MGYGYDVPDHGTEYAVSLLGKVRRFQKEKIAKAAKALETLSSAMRRNADNGRDTEAF